MSSPEEVVFNVVNSVVALVSLFVSVWAIRASKHSTDEREFDALKESVAVLTAHDEQRADDITKIEKIATANNTAIAVLERLEQEHYEHLSADHKIFRDFMQAVATGRVHGFDIRRQTS